MAWVLFFDGDCVFCSTSVRYLIRFDPQGRLAFASLQGKLAGEKGLTQYAAAVDGSMVLLRESDGQTWLRSEALLELAQVLGGAWQIFALARIIPRSLRDRVYRWVADHREWWMGKSDSCSPLDPELRRRMRE